MNTTSLVGVNPWEICMWSKPFYKEITKFYKEHIRHTLSRFDYFSANLQEFCTPRLGLRRHTYEILRRRSVVHFVRVVKYWNRFPAQCPTRSNCSIFFLLLYRAESFSRLDCNSQTIHIRLIRTYGWCSWNSPKNFNVLEYIVVHSFCCSWNYLKQNFRF